MSHVQPDPADPEIQKVAEALKAQIRRRYPDVTFAFVQGSEPADDLYLEVILDIDDLDDVYDEGLRDLLYDVQVEQGISLNILPAWPTDRIARELSQRKKSPRTPSLPALGV